MAKHWYSCCWKPLNRYFRRRGTLLLALITLLEILFYIAYTVIYCLKEQEKHNPIQNAQIFKWLIAAVLLLSQIYFLWHSVSENNPLRLLKLPLMKC
jgi:putative copper export protein